MQEQFTFTCKYFVVENQAISALGALPSNPLITLKKLGGIASP
jgi:hypothetical protein